MFPICDLESKICIGRYGGFSETFRPGVCSSEWLRVSGELGNSGVGASCQTTGFCGKYSPYPLPHCFMLRPPIANYWLGSSVASDGEDYVIHNLFLKASIICGSCADMSLSQGHVCC